VPFYQAYQPYIDENMCVDWSSSAHGNRYSDSLCDLNADLPFADAEFDTVLLASVLEHVARPDTAWREAARVLRPGGHIMVSVPFLYWVHEMPHDYYRYTEFALRRFCNENHLEVAEFRIVGGAPEVLVDVSAKMLASFSKLGRLASAAVQRIGLFSIRLWPLSALSRRTSHLFPLSYVLVARKSAPGESVTASVRPGLSGG
jgi:SAM-dependent methyltransferase